MAGALGVLGLVTGALLYRIARKRLDIGWIAAIFLTGILSGLVLGRASTLPPTRWTDLVQRGAVGVVGVAWYYVVIEAVKARRSARD